VTETSEVPAPVAETESRQVRRARERKVEKDKKRRAQLAGAPIKKARRNISFRGKVQLHQRTLAGLLVELRQMTAGLEQQREIVNILLEIVCKHAAGREVSEEDKAVLDDYLDECDEHRKEKEAAAAEAAAPKQEQVGDAVFPEEAPVQEGA